METEPRLLIIETSGRVGQVGLAEGGRLLQTRRLNEARRHARDLAPAIGDLLQTQGWQPRDLHGVIVSRGPGSYTGLRVGIMSAKTLAYATDAALILVDTFAAIAEQTPAEIERVDIVSDAQQQRLYIQTFARSGVGGSVLAEGPLRIEAIADWLARRPSSDWVSGPGVRVYRDRFPPTLRLLNEESWDPRLENLLKIGFERFARNERDDGWSAEPLYLRPSSAEEKWRSASPGKQG
jgi:tRNA threonylcarbamoyladenosine biosynthesis protein TsaB